MKVGHVDNFSIPIAMMLFTFLSFSSILFAVHKATPPDAHALGVLMIGIFFLNKELSNTEAEMFKIATRHGIKSVLEFDELLKGGKVKEEDIIDDFMEFDYLEARRDELLKVIEKLR